MTFEGEAQIVCSSAGTIDGYSPTSGEQLWTYGGIGGNRICSPWNCGEGTFLVGSQTSREFPDEGLVKQSNFAMQVTRTDGKWTPKIRWKTEAASPGMASPIQHAEHAYWVNRSGVVFCLDAKTGEQKYSERVPQSPWATPLGIGDQVYIFGKDGLTTVLKAGPTFEILSQNQLWDPNIAADLSVIAQETDLKRKAGAAMHTKPEIMGVAAVSGSLLIRTGKDLYCVRGMGAAQ
jgi:outer membrane protein assembly factor BamB